RYRGRRRCLHGGAHTWHAEWHADRRNQSLGEPCGIVCVHAGGGNAALPSRFSCPALSLSLSIRALPLKHVGQVTVFSIGRVVGCTIRPIWSKHRGGTRLWRRHGTNRARGRPKTGPLTRSKRA